MKPTLIVLLGPTGIGKTDLAIQLAKHLKSPIINCDSRQIYADLHIGTASPTPAQQREVTHYFVGKLPLDQYYSAAQYESEVCQLLDELFKTHDRVILTGGSMMYIDAVYQGIDDIPTIDEHTRAEVKRRHETEGLEALVSQLQQLDPEYYNIVDRKNPKRVIHALEICLMTGKTYTSFRKKVVKERPFRILKVGLQRPREELFARINLRVEQMMHDGFLEEARKVYALRHLNSLNTVGYKELFRVLDGEWQLEMAVERIKKNTRVYAKKQMTWFAHDTSIRWFHPNEADNILAYIDESTLANSTDC